VRLKAELATIDVELAGVEAQEGTLTDQQFLQHLSQPDGETQRINSNTRWTRWISALIRCRKLKNPNADVIEF
jgi:hypothetical protein